MRKLQFYGLPRSIQDRFIESSRGIAAPQPVLVAPFRNRDHVRWLVAAAGAAAGWMGLSALGFGDLSSALALTGVGVLALHVVFAFAVIFCALRAQALRWEAARTPFPPGTYVFPSAIIDAKRAELIEHDLTQVERVQLEGARVVLEFAGGQRLSFDAGNAEAAADAQRALEQGRSRSEHAHDDRERARLNPLVDSGVPNPLAPTSPHRNQRFLAPAVFWVMSVGMAVAMGGAVWWARNTLSERALYASAVEQGSVAAFRAYLERGGPRPEVRSVLLPRAELAEVQAVGTVEAVQQYIATHPTSQIGPEIQTAHRAALLAELAKAQRVGTVAAVEALRAKYPGHALIEQELQQARHAVFARALDAFKREAPAASAETLRFVQALLTYTEAHGPRVDVRMAHEFPQTRESLDKILLKSRKYYMGQRSLPSQYFVEEHAQRRETQLAKSLIERLQQSFPKDVVELRFAGPAAAPNLELPEPSVPTLTLSHEEKLSGGFIGGKPKTIFLGASVTVSGTFTIPGEAQRINVQTGRWATPSMRVLEESGQPVPDAMVVVYDAMMQGAFDEFAQAWSRVFFGQA